MGWILFFAGIVILSLIIQYPLQVLLLVVIICVFVFGALAFSDWVDNWNAKSAKKNETKKKNKNIISDGCLEYYADNNGSDVIKVPEKVRRIGANVFKNSLAKEVVLPEQLAAISMEAFDHCSRLETISIPKTVKSIGDRSFQHCSKLTELVLPKELTDLGERTFYYCQNLETIQMSEKITILEKEAFYLCKNLRTINLPDGLTEIREGAFKYCSSLEELVIPDSVRIIGDCAFEGCKNLKKIADRKSVV